MLEIHEAPILGHGRPGRLADRVPIIAEPGIYPPGRGGIRIEDTLVVRPGAARELLTTTTTSREFLVLQGAHALEGLPPYPGDIRRGHHERPQERHDAEHRRAAVDRR
ncbi:MAG TPA: M24 family metallopeptidase [Streptosporangiaceae bacterium]|nr:M24 family metallopeptidase [Streptosporangiaceae bacterium]